MIYITYPTYKVSIRASRDACSLGFLRSHIIRRTEYLILEYDVDADDEKKVQAL